MNNMATIGHFQKRVFPWTTLIFKKKYYDNVISEYIINHVFYSFMSDNSDKYFSTIDVNAKTLIKELLYYNFIIPLLSTIW